jgi:3-hydroxyacyl-CoA dehydrogenase
MNKIDLIIDNIMYAKIIKESAHQDELLEEALAAARELRELKPVAYMDSKGILFNDTTHPHLNTALYALDEETK